MDVDTHHPTNIYILSEFLLYKDNIHLLNKSKRASLMTQENTTFEEPSSEVDRLIYYILARGQKREVEIAELLSHSRFSKRSIKENHIRPLPDKYEWADVTGNVNNYYFRTDIGRHFTKPTMTADHSKVERVLTNLEVQLGLKPRNSQNLPSSVPETDVDSEALTEFIRLSNSYDELFTTTDHLSRFFDILDEIIHYAEESYPKKEAFASVMCFSSYRKFFLLVAERHDKWREGHEHEEFDNEFRKFSGDLVRILKFVPSEIGGIIQPVLTITDKEQGREAFKNMLDSNNYDTKELFDYVRFCYIDYNEMHQLKRELNELRLSTSDPDILQDIETLQSEIRLYEDS